LHRSCSVFADNLSLDSATLSETCMTFGNNLSLDNDIQCLLAFNLLSNNPIQSLFGFCCQFVVWLYMQALLARYELIANIDDIGFVTNLWLGLMSIWRQFIINLLGEYIISIEGTNSNKNDNSRVKRKKLEIIQSIWLYIILVINSRVSMQFIILVWLKKELLISNFNSWLKDCLNLNDK